MNRLKPLSLDRFARIYFNSATPVLARFIVFCFKHNIDCQVGIEELCMIYNNPCYKGDIRQFPKEFYTTWGNYIETMALGEYGEMEVGA